MANSKVRDFLGLTKCEGDVGVEIEVEARKPLPTPCPTSNWRREEDGSLRGFSAEYVMNKPVSAKVASEMLDFLRNLVSDTGSQPVQSYRAGVHVHVNVQEMTMEEVVRFALLYYCFEDVFVKYCGESREGNHFCLRIRDAESPLHILEMATYEKSLLKLNNDIFRYSSLNFCALFKYGSVEFRAMETREDFSKIEEWVEMLLALRDYSLKLKSRSEIAERMSYLGPEALLYEIVGEKNYKLLAFNGMEQQILQSMRGLQMAIFSEELE